MKKRTGRPAKAAPPQARASLGLKVTSELKERLETAAAQSGRTQSQEAERRLEQSFHNESLLFEVMELAFGTKCAALFLLFGRVANSVGPPCALANTGSFVAAQNWMDDPHAYDEVVRGFLLIISQRKPPGISTITPANHPGKEFAQQLIANLASGECNVAGARSAAVAAYDQAKQKPRRGAAPGEIAQHMLAQTERLRLEDEYNRALADERWLINARKIGPLGKAASSDEGAR